MSRPPDTSRGAHGVDCYRPTAAEADVISKARHELSTLEVWALEQAERDRPKPPQPPSAAPSPTT